MIKITFEFENEKILLIADSFNTIKNVLKFSHDINNLDFNQIEEIKPPEKSSDFTSFVDHNIKESHKEEINKPDKPIDVKTDLKAAVSKTRKKINLKRHFPGKICATCSNEFTGTHNVQKHCDACNPKKGYKKAKPIPYKITQEDLLDPMNLKQK